MTERQKLAFLEWLERVCPETLNTWREHYEREMRWRNCRHERLDMEGVCYDCGADCRGAHY